MGEKIKNSNELEFVVFCIENVATKLGVEAERVYQAFAEPVPGKHKQNAGYYGRK